MNEQREALKHLKFLKTDDVVVYDRGYLSYPLIYKHDELSIDGIFRLKKQSFKMIDNFISSDCKDEIVEVIPSQKSYAKIQKKYNFINNRKSIKMRRVQFV